MYKNHTFSPIWQHETPDFRVELHGNEPRYNTDSERLAMLKLHINKFTKDEACWCHVHTASGPDKAGFRDILPLKLNTDLQCDGIIQTKKSVSISQTADCPTVILFNPVTSTLVSTHAGRPACSPDKNGKNVVTKALETVSADTSPKSISAVIVGGIAGKHFRHNLDQKGKMLAQPFLDTYGAIAFADVKDLSIDLVKLISWQLTEFGIPKENIIHDDLCTYENSHLASYRRDKNRRLANTVLVIKK